MSRLYFTCPIQVIYMMQEFEVQFEVNKSALDQLHKLILSNKLTGKKFSSNVQVKHDSSDITAEIFDEILQRLTPYFLAIVRKLPLDDLKSTWGIPWV